MPVVNYTFQKAVAESHSFQGKSLLSVPKLTFLPTSSNFKVSVLCHCFPYHMNDTSHGEVWSLGSCWSCSRGRSTGLQDHKMNNMNRKTVREKRRGWTWTFPSPRAQERIIPFSFSGRTSHKGLRLSSISTDSRCCTSVP